MVLATFWQQMATFWQQMATELIRFLNFIKCVKNM
jgi:hypothetical protein